MKTNLTVLMSVYNDERYLRESIESILEQTYSDFEFLIFDDASTDGSNKILKEYQRADDRIKIIINKTNKGLSYNLAEGVSIAKGDWIARMDADDIAIENRLLLQMKYIEKNPHVDIVGGYVIDVDDEGNKLDLRKVPITHEKIDSLIWTCPFIHPTVLYRKKSIIKVGSYNKKLRRRQDYELWFRCSAANLQFANINTPLIYYRTTRDYYKKNNFKVQVYQAKMGLKGAILVKASPVAYLGIAIAFFKGILPYRIRRPLSEALKKFDPRRNSS